MKYYLVPEKDIKEIVYDLLASGVKMNVFDIIKERFETYKTISVGNSPKGDIEDFQFQMTHD